MAIDTSALSKLRDANILRGYLAGADLPSLIAATAHLTGDYSLLKKEWQPKVAFFNCACAVTPEDEKGIRALCAERIAAFFASGKPVPPAPSYDQIAIIGKWYLGDEFDPILPYIAEECVTDDTDLRRPRWHKDQIAPDRSMHVAIVGAGMSGLVAAFRLKQAGVPFTVYEKNPDVGGTWWENKYPGCRCDLHSFTYSYAFKRRTWNDVFALQPEILAYLQEMARECGLYEHIRFNCEITKATWSDERSGWELDLKTKDGEERVFNDVVLFTVGQLNRPRFPDIPGISSFDGPSFHSARWDHSVDLTGKRVAIIGTGASAVQFTPQVAKKAGHVTVFARSTAWHVPTPDLHDPVSDNEKWLLDNLPHFAMWRRVTLIVSIAIGVLDACVVDPDYPPSELAVSAKSDALRAALQAWQEENIKDRPDLRDVVIPNSAVAAKRVVRDNGTWTNTLKRDNVSVVREAPVEITPRGIKTADGTEREFDVIVYGTGFRASDYLFPVKLYGRGGIELAQFWDGNARAYIGSTIANFPNLFCLYGPKTNLAAHGGTIIQMSEMGTKYVVDAIRYMLEANVRELEVRQEVFDAYNDRLEEENKKRTWGHTAAGGWYRNAKGHALVYPFPVAEYWRRTDHIDPADYIAK